ncbi:type II toxin-antitoxin system HipA family toxin [Rhodoglobus sp.]
MKPSDIIEVAIGGGASPTTVGILRPSFQGGRSLASSSFEYTSEYLGSGNAATLSPDLPLITGRIFTPANKTLFGVFSDASPDEWGQKVIEANRVILRKRNPELPRVLGEFDYLMGVSDATRMGDIRLRFADGPWQAPDHGIANIHNLNKIVEVAARYDNNEATDEDIAYLNDIATSPGGARPKANVVTKKGRLAIAKLPHSKDRNLDVEAWEAVALTIASSVDIHTPQFQLVQTPNGKSVLVVERFDRTEPRSRRGYISGATALGIGANDTSTRTYEDFADAIGSLSTDPSADLREMFSRVALTVLINNVDDHWRNHGFLRDGGGWRLAPAFDINPSPHRGSINSRAINADDDPRERDIRNLISSSATYGLSSAEAAESVFRIATAVEKWRDVAATYGLPASQTDLISQAFDQKQLERAKSIRAAFPPTTIPMAARNAGAILVKAHTRNGAAVAEHWRKPR